MKLQRKSFHFDISETKVVTREDGQKFGVIEGFLATFGNFDRGDDTFLFGAFTESIQEHKSRNNRPIRMLFQHDRWSVIGGFPIELVEQTEKGLKVTGEINLDVQKGREAYALAKQGVITDMSIGFSIDEKTIDEDGRTTIKKATVWEGSLVDEPMNTEATITQVKSFNIEDVELIKTKKDFEKFLRDVGATQKAAKALASRFQEVQREVVPNENTITKDMSQEQSTRISELIKSFKEQS